MDVSRRDFNLLSAAAALALVPRQVSARPAEGKWYERVKRWGQLNLAASDVAEFDLPFWRSYWKATRSQGVIISAGGQLAFYPTNLADQPRAPGLGDRDLFGDVVKACRDDGMEVLARMSLRGAPDLMAKHPEWVNVSANGTRLTTPCMNGGYFYDYGADIVREVAQRYRPAGFTLSGWGTNYALCYCDTCTSLFRKATGQAIPQKRNFDDPVYRRWVEWNSDQVIALWDHGNQVAKAAGGPDCLWCGQLYGSMLTRSLKRITDRAPIMMLDHQAPEDESGLTDNSVIGKLVNGVGDWRKSVPNGSAFYSPRLNSPQQEELTLWMVEGMAGGVSPWWNLVGAYTEDKRRFAMLPPLMQWHEKNERYLYDRRPVASVGLVWSDTNNIFFGREKPHERVQSPFQGMVNALNRARIPFVVIHADNIDRDTRDVAGIILPNIGAMTDEQIAAVRRFSNRGGGVLATGETSLYDQYGARRADFGLADLFGAHAPENVQAPPAAGSSPQVLESIQSSILASAGVYLPTSLIESSQSQQTFLRLTPELRRDAWGPRRQDEPSTAAGEKRHPALQGFDATDIVYYGGTLQPLRIEPDARALLTFVPPVQGGGMPEYSVFKVTHTDIPGLLVRDPDGKGRTAFLPADLDRRYADFNNPDHAILLANLVRWIVRDAVPITVDAPGSFEVNVYHQPSRMIVHITNLNNSAAWRKPVEEFVPSGPLDLRIKLSPDVKPSSARMLVAEKSMPFTVADGWVSVRVPSVLAHELIVIG